MLRFVETHDTCTSCHHKYSFRGNYDWFDGTSSRIVGDNNKSKDMKRLKFESI